MDKTINPDAAYTVIDRDTGERFSTTTHSTRAAAERRRDDLAAKYGKEFCLGIGRDTAGTMDRDITDDAEGLDACLYCGKPAHSDVVPSAHDDAAWSALATEHAPACEWIETRAHRVFS